MWSDNCGQQYKSHKVFDDVSKYEDIPVMRNYFCAKHGKAEADGAIGHLSMHIDSVVRSGTHEFSDAGDVYRYCQLKLRIHNDDLTKCCHWQRHYFEVSQINCDVNTVSSTVKGTMSLHSVRNVGVRGIIEVRESSCFCEVCFLNEEGECKNRALVEDFAWASLYKNMYNGENVENKLWDTYSLPYSHAKKPIFRPMTGSVSKWKGKKRVSKRNINEKKDSTALASASTNSSNVNNVTIAHRDSSNINNVTIAHHDSDDLDYEDDLPLIYVKEGLKDISQGESPIGRRTRRCLHEKNLVLCQEPREMLYLEDYESDSVSSGCRKKPQKSKSTTNAKYNEKVLRKRNLANGRRTSTPIKLKGFKECYISLSPIPDGFLSQLSKDYDFDN